MRATDGTWRASLSAGAMDVIAARAVVLSIGIAFAIAAFLLARRIAGAFSSPLPLPQLVLTALAVVLWALATRQLSRWPPVFVSAAIVVLFTLALACSYPGSRVVDWLIWPAAMLAVVLCPPFVGKREERTKQFSVTSRD